MKISEIVDRLDPLATRFYQQQLAGQLRTGRPMAEAQSKALEIVVNMVEGDESQLSESLREFAFAKGWLPRQHGGCSDRAKKKEVSK